MSEMEEVMGGNWGDYGEQNFQTINPMEAMDTLNDLMNKGGYNEVAQHPKRWPLINAMAKVTEQEIEDWANKMVPDQNPEHVDIYYDNMKTLRNAARRTLELPPVESKPQ